MRRILLATTAAAALAAGSSLAMAQVSGSAGAGGGANVQQHTPGGTGVNAGARGNVGARGMTSERGGQGMGREERGGHMGTARGEERGERTGRDLGKNARGEVREGRELREGGGAYRAIRDHVTPRLSSDQRTRIHERLFSEGARAHRLGHVDFALRRGVRVPHSVIFYDLPEDIVTLVPAYQHYKYFLVADEIVIVDPVTYEIVDVVPA